MHVYNEADTFVIHYLSRLCANREYIYECGQAFKKKKKEGSKDRTIDSALRYAGIIRNSFSPQLSNSFCTCLVL